MHEIRQCTGSRCDRWASCGRACVARRMCHSWWCVDHRRVGGGRRTWPRRSSWMDGGWRWRGGGGIVRERRQASIMPALAAVAHLDAVELGRSAGQPSAACAAAWNRLRSRRWKTLCSTRHRESDKMDRRVSRWVIHCACCSGCVAYCMRCAHLLMRSDCALVTRNLLAARRRLDR